MKPIATLTASPFQRAGQSDRSCARWKTGFTALTLNPEFLVDRSMTVT